MACDEPHLTLNEKAQPIQWTERPTGALMAAGSLWPVLRFSTILSNRRPPSSHLVHHHKNNLLDNHLF